MGMYCELYSLPENAARNAFSSRIREAEFQRHGGTSVSLEKSWHGLHYLLTKDASGGAGPLAFLVAGGETLGRYHDDTRMFRPREVAQWHATLSAVSDEKLWSRYDADNMNQQGIYPQIWDEPEQDLREEYLGYFHELKKLVQSAAANSHAVVVSIG